MLVAGCTSTPTQAPVDDKSAAARHATGAAPPGRQHERRPRPPASAAARPAGATSPLHDPNSILSKRIVYFDFDSFVVKDEYRPLVEAHAKYLQTQPRRQRMTLQGHADERGSREYNIALGQKRADAVKQLMMLLGASECQIETVSFGEEKPKVAGHDEDAGRRTAASTSSTPASDPAADVAPACAQRLSGVGARLSRMRSPRCARRARGAVRRRRGAQAHRRHQRAPDAVQRQLEERSPRSRSS